jgi:hypothetical protein
MPPKEKGCLGVLVYVFIGLAVLVIGGLATLYFVVMHTSVPFKALESMLASANTNAHFKVEGISGTISTGFKIRSIRWGEDGAGAGEIKDVRVTYGNFRELMGGRRIVFREIHIGRAHLDVTGLGELVSSANTPSVNFGNNPPTNYNWTTAGGWPARKGPDLVKIDKVTIEDVFLTNRVTGLSLAIPSIQWTGFKAANGQVELGRLEVDSDRLKITTKEGRTVDVDGRQVAFQKMLEGTLLPGLHKSISRPIAFTVDAGTAQGKLVVRATAFEGGLEIYRAPGQDGFVRCKDLDLDSYFDAPVPRALTVSAVMVPGNRSRQPRLKLGGGSFNLGVRTFEIQPAELERTEGADDVSQTNNLIAVSHSDAEEFTYQLIVSEEWWKVRQSLTARRAMTPQETLAKVFTGKSYEELDPAQREEIDRKLPAFSGGETPAAEAEKR